MQRAEKSVENVIHIVREKENVKTSACTGVKVAWKKMEKGNGKKEKKGETDAIEEMAGKGGRAAHAGDEAWQCGASA